MSNGNYRLLNYNLVANRAMDARRKSCSRAGRGNGSIGDGRVIFGLRSNRLRNEHFITYRAMATLGQACILTSRGNCSIDNGRVIFGLRSNRLRNKHLVTYRTVTTFGQACILTSRGNGSIDDGRVVFVFWNGFFFDLRTSAASSGAFSFFLASSLFYGVPLTKGMLTYSGILGRVIISIFISCLLKIIIIRWSIRIITCRKCKHT